MERLQLSEAGYNLQATILVKQQKRINESTVDQFELIEVLLEISTFFTQQLHVILSLFRSIEFQSKQIPIYNVRWSVPFNPAQSDNDVHMPWTSRSQIC